MGNFRLVLSGVGGHGVDREKGHGEQVDFEAAGPKSPDAIIARCIEELKASGVSLIEATLTHWPGTDTQVVDNVLSGKRLGSF